MSKWIFPKPFIRIIEAVGEQLSGGVGRIILGGAENISAVALRGHDRSMDVQNKNSCKEQGEQFSKCICHVDTSWGLWDTYFVFLT